MRVIIKKPGIEATIEEVSGFKEINEMLGNLDDNGNMKFFNSDIRTPIGNNVDMYCYGEAINNFEQKQNLWHVDDGSVLFGTIIFCGYDNKLPGSGCCSLNDAQIEYTLNYIKSKEV